MGHVPLFSQDLDVTIVILLIRILANATTPLHIVTTGRTQTQTILRVAIHAQVMWEEAQHLLV
jgi:hypothetical protein